MKKLAILGMAALSGIASADVLYDNGPVVNAAGRSVIFARDAIYGYADSTAGGFSVADDFSVASGSSWNVSSVDVFNYQTGAGNSFTFSSVSWEILSSDMSTVVASGTSAATNGGLVGYRTTLGTLHNTDRAIYDIKASIPNVTLSSGSYWLAWGVTGSSTFSGPWQPALSDHSTGNAMQSTDGGLTYTALAARTTPSGQYFGNPQDLPFILNGTAAPISAIPEPATLLSLSAGLVLLGALRRRRSK